MLSSAPKKIKPPNDAEFVKRAAGRGPKAFLWSYDDDKAWLKSNFISYKLLTNLSDTNILESKKEYPLQLLLQ